MKKQSRSKNRKVKMKRTLNKAEVKIKVELYSVRILLYLVFAICYFAFSFFTHNMLVAIILFISYTFLRWCFPTTWHHNRTMCCITYSIITFCVCANLSMKVQYSILSSVIVSLTLTFGLYKLQTLIDNSVVTKFDADTCTEADLLKRCRELKFSARQTRLAVEYFIKKKTHNAVADEESIDVESSWKAKNRLKNKLNKRK